MNNVENEVITNMLFQDLMSKKSLVTPSECNAVVNVYEELVITTTPQKIIRNIDIISECSSLSRDTTEWLPKNIDEPGPSRQLFNNSKSRDSINDVQQLLDSDCSASSVSGVIRRAGIRKKIPVRAIRARKKLKLVSGEGKKIQPCACILKKKCHNKICGNNFSENDRLNIFNAFWALCDKTRQRDYLLKFVKPVDVKRKRVKGPSRRTFSNKYFLIRNNEEIEVCQQFILTTLNISQKLLRCTVNNISPINVSSVDKRGKNQLQIKMMK